MTDFADTLQNSNTTALGAHWDGRGTHFAVFAEDAEKVELCIFDGSGRHQIARLPMPDCTHGVWSGYLPNAQPGTQYGYRVYGPYDPKRGHRFNHHKLLLDPYARQTAGSIKWHDALFGYHVGSPKGDLSFDRRDSASYMPKAVVTDNFFDWGGDRPPRVPWHETVIYEMHVRGFTQLRQDLPEHDRGTFGALGHPSTIDYLKRLGVTSIELLPIHLFLRDRTLVDKQLTNYWGYNTLGFFAPDLGYLSDNTIGQVKWAIKQLHAAGIEVILDVVYNHTCEGNEMGPTLSWRGFGNASYYRLLPDDPRYHINDTGCGNTMDMSHRRVIQMILDSLRYWVQEYHIDGFRFDLCATLGREPHGFDPGSGFFDALMQDPVLSQTKLIAEPWDIGPGGHQVGNHPAGFAEWNDYFRDDARRFWRGDANTRAALAARLQGSADIFDHAHRRPWSGVNFITAHDGFTLEDLVSYNQKHNKENGEDNRDGTDNNLSNNWGVEGPTDDEKVLAVREKIKRNLIATLFCSHGTPMFQAGDEFGRSQYGNNNAYCQDNEISWLDWSKLDDPEGKSLWDFTARLIEIRKSSPLLQGRYFQHADIEVAPGVPDVFWFGENGKELQGEQWHKGGGNHVGLQRCVKHDDDFVEIVVLLMNPCPKEYLYKLPFPELEYCVHLDTSEDLHVGEAINEGSVQLHGRSTILLGSRVHIDHLRDIVESRGADEETEEADELEDDASSESQLAPEEEVSSAQESAQKEVPAEERE
jgi:isoamylase